MMAALLQVHGKTINGVFAQDDNMAIGAIQAIQTYGLTPGVDIKIVSIDGRREALQAIVDGKLNATIDSTTLMGQQFFETAFKLANGQPVEHFVMMDNKVWTPKTVGQSKPNHKY